VTALRLDEGWVVWVAARALHRDPGRLLAECDVAALAGVVADIDAVADNGAVEQAATVLTAVARRRPFTAGNRAVAWLCAAVLLDGAGVPIALDDEAAYAAVVAAEDGSRSADQLAALLGGDARATGPTLGRSCPACGRQLHGYEGGAVGSGPLLVGTSRYELVARCWYEHRAHGRDGEALVAVEAPPADPWRPVVKDAGSEAVLVLTDDGAVLLLADGDGYRATVHREVPIGGLVGPWSSLADAGDMPTFVPAAWVRFDPTGALADADLLLAGLHG
jgi:hypothetical protein